MLLVAVVITAVGIAGKGRVRLFTSEVRGNRLLVGVAMIPRGEVGLIFAQVGLASGAIGPGEFGAIMAMVVVTTLVDARTWLACWPGPRYRGRRTRAATASTTWCPGREAYLFNNNNHRHDGAELARSDGPAGEPTARR